MMTAMDTVAATVAPSSGSSSPPTSSGWLALNRRPSVERMTIANIEITTLLIVSHPIPHNILEERCVHTKTMLAQR